MRLSLLLTKVIDFFYLPAIKRVVPLQTFRYGACGGLNVVLDTLLYYVIFHYVLCESNLDLGIVVISGHIAAMCITFPITFFNGFWLNRNIAFRRSPLGQGTQLSRYLLSVAGSLLINYLCMKLFVEVVHIYPTPSKLISTLITIAYSYLMQKYYTFRGCAER